MYLLDANVISEVRKVRAGTADGNVAEWAGSVNVAELFLSAITIHELELGILLLERRDPRQGVVLRKWMNQHLLPAFESRIIPIDHTVAKRSTELHAPAPRPLKDVLVAATALIHGMTAVTRNATDFTPTGVSVLNPLEARESRSR